MTGKFVQGRPRPPALAKTFLCDKNVVARSVSGLNCFWMFTTDSYKGARVNWDNANNQSLYRCDVK